MGCINIDQPECDGNCDGSCLNGTSVPADAVPQSTSLGSGWISEFVFSAGTAKYTEGFPPPPEPYMSVPDIVEGDELPSICGALSLEKDECIVAVSESGTGYIIARSNDIIERDILMEDTAEDCGFNHNWDEGLLVGVYRLCIKPWSATSYEGEHDCGIDVLACSPLWKVEEVKDENVRKSEVHDG